MLSKAEVQYLQGQKMVSGSYERKLKCLIRKKVENLKKELPLLSKNFPIDHLFNEGNREPKGKVEEKPFGKPISSNSHAATKISNSNDCDNAFAVCEVNGSLLNSVDIWRRQRNRSYQNQ